MDSLDLGTPPSRNSMLRLFSTYGRHELPQFLLGGVASVLSRSTELVPPFILGVAIDSLFFDNRQFSLPLLPEGWLPTTTWEQFILILGIVASTYFLRGILGWINSWAWNHFSQHFQHRIRTDTYDLMQRLELAFFEDKQTGEIMSVLNNDVNQLEEFLTDRLNQVIRIAIRVGGMGMVMLLMNWQLAVVPVILIPALAGVSYAFMQLIHPKYQTVRSSVGSLNARLENNIAGIEVIKSYNKEDFESNRVEEASRDYLNSQWDAITTRIKFFPAVRVVTAIGYSATFFIGGYWVLFGPPPLFSGQLTAGVLVTFLIYTRRFIWPMRQFGQIINEYEYAQAASDRIIMLMNRSGSIPEKDGATPFSGRGAVEYDDVRFSYTGGDNLTLEGVSFASQPGDTIGVVGPTGAGKTTLVKLLMRMYDVDEGSIKIDGTDIRDYTLGSLRESINYVSQEPYLFHGTVRENIAYGRPDIEKQSVREAAEIAGAHEFICQLPNRYDTVVGERGVKLSGGQRQRISIARALLDDPSILILDEATSHVDHETEVVIQNNLDALSESQTTFIVAHRLSTVTQADKILVLEDGQVVEDGPHTELLSEDGLYAKLWTVQVGEVESLPKSFIESTSHAELLDGTD